MTDAKGKTLSAQMIEGKLLRWYALLSAPHEVMHPRVCYLHLLSKERVIRLFGRQRSLALLSPRDTLRVEQKHPQTSHENNGEWRVVMAVWVLQ